jgi:hypothetical protein
MMNAFRNHALEEIPPRRLTFGDGGMAVEGRWDGDRLHVDGVGSFVFRLDPCSGEPLLGGPVRFEPAAPLPEWTRPL